MTTVGDMQVGPSDFEVHEIESSNGNKNYQVIRANQYMGRIILKTNKSDGLAMYFSEKNGFECASYVIGNDVLCITNLLERISMHLLLQSDPKAKMYPP